MSASSMSRFLGLGAVAATGHSNRATSLRFQRCLQVLDHLLKLLVREVLEQMLCSTLCSRRTSSARPFEVARWLLPCNPPPLKWSDLRYVFDIKED